MALGDKFPDRREILFGRAPDVVYLIERARYKGLSAVVARPQMGKSWLLAEIARSLSDDHEPHYLVGFTESVGQSPDLFLRAVVDLYTRWLSDASYWKQAKIVWEQQKGNLITSAGRAVGSVFQQISKVGSVATAPVGTLVKEAFDGLAAANKTLSSGGVQIPALQYDQARDLVNIVAGISGKPIAITIDQWEQSPSIEFEAKTLEAFLRHLEDWPLCHVFVALRREEPAFGFARKLADSLPGTAEVYELGLMHLDDPSTRSSLLSLIRQRVPATRGEEDSELLRMIDGYPGTIYRWTSEYHIAKMRTHGDLESVAANAQTYRFDELNDQLQPLTPEERSLAIRLALIPTTTTELWELLKQVILNGQSEDLLDDLKAKNALEGSNPPTYGHPKRWEAAWQWFVRHRIAAVREVSEAVIFRLARHVQSVEPQTVPFAGALAGLLSAADQLELSDIGKALCQAMKFLNITLKYRRVADGSEFSKMHLFIIAGGGTDLILMDYEASSGGLGGIPSDAVKAAIATHPMRH